MQKSRKKLLAELGSAREWLPITLQPKPVFDLRIDLARQVPVRAAEGVALIELVAAVGKVQRGDSHRPVLAERFAERQVKRCVRCEMVRAISVQKARAVGDVGGGPAPQGKARFYARAERVPLVVVEKK